MIYQDLSIILSIINYLASKFLHKLLGCLNYKKKANKPVI
jgi:hypothetical protein